MSNIADKIIKTIKEKNIKPKPRWHFIVRQVLIWLASILSIAVGSFAFSVILFRLVNNDWEILKFINRSPAAHMLNTLPYIWIVLLILFVGLAYYNTRHTKGAYKYHAYWFLIASLLVSIALGGMLYAFGLGPRVHYAAEKIPIIKGLMYDKDLAWDKAEDGFIAGEVTEMLSGVGMFELEDLSNYKWIIRPGEKYYPPPEDFIIEQGVKLRIYGEKIDKEIFEAMKVMPYQKGPGIEKGKIPGKRLNGGYKKIPF